MAWSTLEQKSGLPVNSRSRRRPSSTTIHSDACPPCSVAGGKAETASKDEFFDAESARESFSSARSEPMVRCHARLPWCLNAVRECLLQWVQSAIPGARHALGQRPFSFCGHQTPLHVNPGLGKRHWPSPDIDVACLFLFSLRKKSRVCAAQSVTAAGDLNDEMHEQQRAREALSGGTMTQVPDLAGLPPCILCRCIFCSVCSSTHRECCDWAAWRCHHAVQRVSDRGENVCRGGSPSLRPRAHRCMSVRPISPVCLDHEVLETRDFEA